MILQCKCQYTCHLYTIMPCTDGMTIDIYNCAMYKCCDYQYVSICTSFCCQCYCLWCVPMHILDRIRCNCVPVYVWLYHYILSALMSAAYAIFTNIYLSWFLHKNWEFSSVISIGIIRGIIKEYLEPILHNFLLFSLAFLYIWAYVASI